MSYGSIFFRSVSHFKNFLNFSNQKEYLFSRLRAIEYTALHLVLRCHSLKPRALSGIPRKEQVERISRDFWYWEYSVDLGPDRGSKEVEKLVPH